MVDEHARAFSKRQRSWSGRGYAIGLGANRDPKIKQMRRANSESGNRFGPGGKPKSAGRVRPVTLASVSITRGEP